jgi:tRNA(adenine34) deaminase
MDHVGHMRQALDLARQALDRDEFPVGCVMVHDGRVIAHGSRINTRQAVPSELDHAEMIALRRLEALADPVDRKQISVYVTLEPCLMCFGALLISGIGTLVHAYEDAMGGGTVCDRSLLPPLYRNNAVDIVSGVCRAESLSLFKNYFSLPHIDYWRDSLLARYTLAQPTDAGGTDRSMGVKTGILAARDS